MNIDIENLRKINPEAVEVLENKFVETLEKDPDSSLLSIIINGYEYDMVGRGEIMAIQGKTGTGKTILVEMLIAAAISGQVGKFVGKGIQSILHVDTEQSRNQWLDVNFRILKYAREKNTPDGYYSLSLKRYGTDQRMLLLNDIIMASEGIDLIVLDGIADIMLNVNDIESATRTIDDIQTWIDTKKSGFITILHENKSKDNNNMKGHIGSYLNQKATTTIAVNKKKDSNVIEIDPVKTRGRPWYSQQFTINDMKMVDTGDVYKRSPFMEGARERKDVDPPKSSIIQEAFHRPDNNNLNDIKF